MSEAQYDHSHSEICFREAGHAVMALAFDYAVAKVASSPEPYIRAFPPAELQSVTDLAQLKAHYQAQVLVKLAPAIGVTIHHEIHSAAGERGPKPHTTDEAGQAARLLDAFGQESKECLKEYIGYAAYILKQEPYLTLVKQMATLLRSKGHLGATEIARFHSDTPKLDILDVAEVLDELLPARYRNLYPELLGQD